MENQLTSATSPQSSATYTYDPLSSRSGKTVTGSQAEDLRFLCDGAEVIADSDPSGTIIRRYVYGPGIDERVAMYIGDTTTSRRFYLTDPQGSVVGLTDAAGTLQTTYRYSAYGVPDQYEVASGGNQLRYTGQRLDPETGLYYYRARYYSPALGRFLQTDPIGYGDGLNLYAYVGNDPVNFGDPSGTFTAILSVELDINVPLIYSGSVSLGVGASYTSREGFDIGAVATLSAPPPDTNNITALGVGRATVNLGGYSGTLRDQEGLSASISTQIPLAPSLLGVGGGVSVDPYAKGGTLSGITGGHLSLGYGANVRGVVVKTHTFTARDVSDWLSTPSSQDPKFDGGSKQNPNLRPMPYDLTGGDVYRGQKTSRGK